MPYIERRDGKVMGVYQNLQPGYAEEEVRDDCPDLLEYRKEKEKRRQAYEALLRRDQKILAAVEELELDADAAIAKLRAPAPQTTKGE